MSDRVVLGAAAYAMCRPALAWELQRDDVFRRLEMALATSPRPGVGMAAPQIGLNVRAFVLRIPPQEFRRRGEWWHDKEGVVLDVWNPVVEDRDGELRYQDGCLSYPGRFMVAVDAYDVTFRNGDGRRYELTGFEAAAFAHELRHLDGVNKWEAPEGGKVGRNDACPCGSGAKFKRCHGK